MPQALLLKKTQGVAHRPGSSKKHKNPPSFGVGGRAAINEKVPPDVAMALHPQLAAQANAQKYYGGGIL